MRAFALCLIILVALVNSTKIYEEDYRTIVNRQAISEFVNGAKTTWKAAVHPRFANATLAEMKRFMGSFLPGEDGYEGPDVYKTTFKVQPSEVPTAFDVRTAWPQCASITGRIRDQSNCGSCWAFGSTEAFNDRYCIATGDNQLVLSPFDTLSCCSGPHCAMSMGCNGGVPAGAWRWFTQTGVSTGGDNEDMGTGHTCKPYTLQTCAHHMEPAAGMVACSDVPEYKTPTCTSTCSEATYPTRYLADKHKAASVYGIRQENVQQELMEKGSISATLMIYEDFETYTSGIYQHVTGGKVGAHSVKLVGWGVDNGVPYWTIVNSWNDSWGEKGTFRILRGTNECGIELGWVAGDAV